MKIMYIDESGDTIPLINDGKKFFVLSGCVIDENDLFELEDKFRKIKNELSELHNKMRWESNSIWTKCPRIIEKLLFSQSDKTVGIQIADLYCYPVFHIFEYNKTADEYWRFRECSGPKLYSDIKYLPEETKKDLRFYS